MHIPRREKRAAIVFASPAEREALRAARTQRILNPYAARRAGHGVQAAHMVNKVAPVVGGPALKGFAGLANVAEGADFAAGDLLHRIGIPGTVSEEMIFPADPSTYGKPGPVTGKRVYVNRATGPVSRLAAIGTAIGTALWLRKKLLNSHSSKDQNDVDQLGGYTQGIAAPPAGAQMSTVKSAEMKQAAHVLEQQVALIQELHSFASNQAKTAAAVCQAVKLAQDGLIDVSDVLEHANQLLAGGDVKISSVDELLSDSIGRVVEDGPANAEQQLDPLTRVLREVGAN